MNLALQVFTPINNTLASVFGHTVAYAAHIPSYVDTWVRLAPDCRLLFLIFPRHRIQCIVIMRPQWIHLASEDLEQQASLILENGEQSHPRLRLQMFGTADSCKAFPFFLATKSHPNLSVLLCGEDPFGTGLQRKVSLVQLFSVVWKLLSTWSAPGFLGIA